MGNALAMSGPQLVDPNFSRVEMPQAVDQNTALVGLLLLIAVASVFALLHVAATRKTARR